MSEALYNLNLSEADIEALKTMGFSLEITKAIRDALDAHHKRLFHFQTGEFLADQYHKLMAATDTGEKQRLMWEVVNWKEKYKSPYLKP